MTRPRATLLVCCLLGVAIGLPATTSGDWLKLDPPPDVDKDFPNQTCWLATAANMLAGAGYGESSGSSDVQMRARYIYDELVDHFGFTR